MCQSDAANLVAETGDGTVGTCLEDCEGVWVEAGAVPPPVGGHVRLGVDLRKDSAEDVLRRVEAGLGVVLDRQSEVRKRRSIGACTNRGTWVRIELRSLAKMAAQGQIANGVESAELLTGISKPAWYSAMSWHGLIDEAVVTWRADEVELVTAAPIRSRGSLGDAPKLSNEWWAILSSSLDNLARQRTTRIATPDTETITQDLVTSAIEKVFPNQVDSTITIDEWVPAHADLNWANVTSPDCWILDWEDHGMAPRGLDTATLWVTSLNVSPLAERVRRERQADLGTRSGKLMALFQCAKILNDSSAHGSPIFQPVAREADKLIADLRG